MRRVFMVGWDGATFDLIRPWVREGKLPAIGRLMQKGVHGELRSTVPPWTFPAWTSFMTGKNPGKHGIFDFFRPRGGSYELEFVHGGHRRAATFWQLLSEAGKKVVSISLPCTFPPEKVNGVMISGFDFPGEGPGSYVDARGIYPPELYDELKQHVGRHPIDASIVREFNRGEFATVLQRIVETIRKKAATAHYLMNSRDWDCFMILFGESDGTAHQFWKFIDPNSPLFVDGGGCLRESLLEVYQELDTQLADFLERLPDDTTVLMMSDHGFGGVSDWVIYPNRWLSERGFLRLHQPKQNGLSKVLDAAKLWAVESLPASVQRAIYRYGSRIVGKIESRVRFGTIDWPNTQAYFDETPYFPMLRINLQGRQPQGIVQRGDYERVRSRLIEELEALRHPDTGAPVVEKAYRREELYSGPCVAEAPDVIPKWALHEGYSYAFRKSSQLGGSRRSAEFRWIEQADPRDREYSQFYTNKSGTHRDNGIFLASGPTIAARQGGEIQGARIIDLAPTILALLDVPVPEDMDGRVLHEIFADGHWPACAAYQPDEPEFDDFDDEPVAVGYSTHDERMVSDRLRALGYVE